MAQTTTSVLLTNVKERVRARWGARAEPMWVDVELHQPAPRPRVLKLDPADSSKPERG